MAALTKAEVDALVRSQIREKDFRQQVVDYARLHGWQCWWVWRSDHSPKGWPDLVLAKPPRLVLAELKTERGTLSPAQSETIATLRECGLTVFVWRPRDWPAIEETLTR